MLRPGERVLATVVEIHPFGIFMTFEGHRILVLVPDISYERGKMPHEMAQVGDQFAVIIITYISRDLVYRGSINEHFYYFNPGDTVANLPVHQPNDIGDIPDV